MAIVVGMRGVEGLERIIIRLDVVFFTVLPEVEEAACRHHSYHCIEYSETKGLRNSLSEFERKPVARDLFWIPVARDI